MSLSLDVQGSGDSRGGPFSVLESMTIAAFATGCERGYIYLRGEYPLAQRRLEHAIGQARERGFLGEKSCPGGSASTLSCARAPAPTSAGRRPRSSARSRVTAVSRATSRRFRSSVDCSASPRWSTMSKRSSMRSRSCSRAARRLPASAPSAQPGRSCSASRGCRASGHV